MAEAKAKNVSHEMEIWKQLIETELKTAANWEGQWGFLKGEKALSREGASASAPCLEPRVSNASKAVSLMRSGKLDRSQVLACRSQKPQQRYGRPLITSHEIGWRPSIERFGVSHHDLFRISRSMLEHNVTLFLFPGTGRKTSQAQSAQSERIGVSVESRDSTSEPSLKGMSQGSPDLQQKRCHA
eukprot:s1176_g25.t2